MKEVAQDPSLSYCRRLASSKERGYRWDNCILWHTVVDCVDGDISRIVVPKSRRERVCESLLMIELVIWVLARFAK